MPSEFRQFLKLSLIILAVMLIASVGLIVEPLNGLAWLLSVPVVISLFFIFRNNSEKKD